MQLDKLKDIGYLGLSKDDKKMNQAFSYKKTISLNIANHDTEYNLFLSLDEAFPITRPKFFIPALFNRFKVPIPHLETNGYICMMTDETYCQNSNDDLYATIQRQEHATIEFLQSWIDQVGQNTKYINEIYGELSSYLPEKNIQYTSNIKLLKYEKYVLHVNKDDDTIHYTETNRLLHDRSRYITRSFIYIPFTDDNLILPMDLFNEISYHEFMKKYLPLMAIRKEQKKLLKKINKHKFILFAINHPIHKENKIFIHAHLDKDANTIKFTGVNRSDNNFIFERSGIHQSEKKVLVLGTGSLGGYIIDTLAQNGIVNIDVSDKKLYALHNIYRHVMGNASYVFKNKKKETKQRSYIGESKAKAITHYISHKYLNINMNVIEDDLHISEKKISQYSAIILAIGNTEVEKAIHSKWSHLNIPIISTWIEPLGAGGHVLIKYSKGKGCFNCIYEKYNKETHEYEFVDNQYAFIHNYMQRNISGCSGEFIEYSSIHAQKTALLACEHILNILDGQKYNNVIYYWKGSVKNHDKHPKIKFTQIYEEKTTENIFHLQGCSKCSQ